MNQISIEDVTVSYHGQVALYEASLDINKGNFIGIIGENGSGKTTLLKSILGLVNTHDGNIDIKKGLRIGYVPQYISRQDFTFPATAKEVVLMGLLAEKKGWKKYSRNDHQRVDDIFKMLHIEHLKQKRVGELSGGQQQRVLLARALINNPDVLLLDEPTSALDKIIEDSFLQLLEKLNREDNITVVVVTHDLASLGEYVDQIVYINKTIIFNGKFRDFCQNNQLSPYIHTHDIKGCDE